MSQHLLLLPLLLPLLLLLPLGNPSSTWTMTLGGMAMKVPPKVQLSRWSQNHKLQQRKRAALLAQTLTLVPCGI